MADNKEYIIKLRGDTKDLEAAVQRANAEMERIGDHEFRLKFNQRGAQAEIKALLDLLSKQDIQVDIDLNVANLKDVNDQLDIKKLIDDSNLKNLKGSSRSKELERLFENQYKEIEKARERAKKANEDAYNANPLERDRLEKIADDADDEFARQLRRASYLNEATKQYQGIARENKKKIDDILKRNKGMFERVSYADDSVFNPSDVNRRSSDIETQREGLLNEKQRLQKLYNKSKYNPEKFRGKFIDDIVSSITHNEELEAIERRKKLFQERKKTIEKNSNAIAGKNTDDVLAENEKLLKEQEQISKRQSKLQERDFGYSPIFEPDIDSAEQYIDALSKVDDGLSEIKQKMKDNETASNIADKLINEKELSDLQSRRKQIQDDLGILYKRDITRKDIEDDIKYNVTGYKVKKSGEVESSDYGTYYGKELKKQVLPSGYSYDKRTGQWRSKGGQKIFDIRSEEDTRLDKWQQKIRGKQEELYLIDKQIEEVESSQRKKQLEEMHRRYEENRKKEEDLQNHQKRIVEQQKIDALNEEYYKENKPKQDDDVDVFADQYQDVSNAEKQFISTMNEEIEAQERLAVARRQAQDVADQEVADKNIQSAINERNKEAERIKRQSATDKHTKADNQNDTDNIKKHEEAERSDKEATEANTQARKEQSAVSSSQDNGVDEIEKNTAAQNENREAAEKAAEANKDASNARKSGTTNVVSNDSAIGDGVKSNAEHNQEQSEKAVDAAADYYENVIKVVDYYNSANELVENQVTTRSVIPDSKLGDNAGWTRTTQYNTSINPEDGTETESKIVTDKFTDNVQKEINNQKILAQNIRLTTDELERFVKAQKEAGASIKDGDLQKLRAQASKITNNQELTMFKNDIKAFKQQAKEEQKEAERIEKTKAKYDKQDQQTQKVENDNIVRTESLDRFNKKVQASTLVSKEFKAEVKGLFDELSGAGVDVSALEKFDQHLKKLKADFTDIKGEKGGYQTQLNNAFKFLDTRDNSKYTQKINDEITRLKGQFQKIDLGSIDISTEDGRNQIKEFLDDVEKLKTATKDLGNQTAKQTSIDKLDLQMSQFVKKNHKLTAEYINDIERMRESLQAPDLTKKKYNDIFSEYTQLVTSATDEGLVGGKGVFENFGDQVKRISTNFVATYLSLQDFVRYGRQLISTVTEINSAQTELRKVSDASHARIQENFRTSAETAKELGATITDVISSTSDWARLGYSVDDAEQLARSTTLFQTVGDNMNQQNASEYLTSIMKGYQYDASQSESIIDKVNEVANHYSIDTQGLGEALQRSASAFSTAHTDLDKSIAIITASNEVLQDPEKVGTMWNTVSARIRGADSELTDLGEDTDEYVESTSKLRDLVKGYTGFDIMDDQNNFKDLYEIVLGIGQAWGDLQDIQKAALGEALGGKRNARGLYSVFDHLDTLQGAYQTAATSAGSAAKEQEHYAESIQYSIDRAKASLQELAYDFLSSDMLKSLIDFGNKFLEIVDAIVSHLKPLGTLLVGGGIGSVFRGLTTNKGLFSGIVDMIADKKGITPGVTTITTLSRLFRGKEVSKMAKDAGQEVGEELAKSTGEAVAKGSAEVSGGMAQVIEKATKEFGAETAGNAAANAAAKGMSNAVKDVAEEAAPEAAGGFLSKFGGFLSSHLGAALGIAGIGIGAGVAIYNAVQEGYRKAAEEATAEFTSSTQALESYKSRYSELYKQLKDPNTSEAQSVEIRKEIVSIQQQIIEQFGREAEGIDLVNGKLQEELGLMDQIAVKEAVNDVNDFKTGRGFDKAIDKMTKVSHYELGQFRGNVDEEGSLANEARKIAEGLGVGFEQNEDGFYHFVFDADIEDAKEKFDDLQAAMSGIKREYETLNNAEGKQATFEIENFIGASGARETDIDKIIAKNGEIFHNAVYEKFLAEYENDTATNTLVQRYSQAIKDMETAAVSENMVDYAKAQSEKVDVLGQMQALEDYDSMWHVIIEDTDAAHDSTLDLKMDVTDIFDGNGINKDNPYADNINEIREAAEELKKQKIDEGDWAELTKDMDELGTTAPAIKKLGKALNFDLDNPIEYTDEINKLKSVVMLLPDVWKEVEDTIGTSDVQDRFEEFRAGIITQIANIDTLNGAMAESFGGKGLSYSIDESTHEIVGSVGEVKKAYEEIMGVKGLDQSYLFERTANGIHLNQEALRDLQKQQKDNTMQRFANQQKDLEESEANLQRRLAAIQEAEKNGIKTANTSDQIQSQIDAVRNNIQSLKDLRSAYEGSTSAYQKWVEAQSMGEEGDMYNAIRDTAIKRGKELYDQNLVGTNEFRSIAQLFSNEDLTTAPIEKIVSAYEDGAKAVSQYFTEDNTGLVKFAEKVKSMGDEVGHVSGENGEYSFFGMNFAKIADKLGVSEDIINSIFRRFNDYGFNIRFFDEEQVQQLNEIKNRADDAQAALKKMDDVTADIGGKKVKLSDAIDFDIAELDKEGLTSKLSELTEFRDQLIKVNADPTQIQLLDTLIQQLQADIDITNGATVSPNVNFTDLVKVGEKIAELQEKLKLFNEFKLKNPELKIEEDPQLMADLQYVASLGKEQLKLNYGIEVDDPSNVQEVADAIMNMPDEKTTTVDAKTNYEPGNIEKPTEDQIDATAQTDYKPGNIEKPSQEELDTTAYVKYVQEPIKRKKYINDLAANKKVEQKVSTKEEHTTTTNENVNKNTNITAIDNATPVVNAVSGAINRLVGKEVKIDADASKALSAIKKVDEENINPKTVYILGNDSSFWTKAGKIASYNFGAKSVTVTANTFVASKNLQGVINKLNLIKDKTVTVKTNYVSNGKPGAANGTAHALGTTGKAQHTPSYYTPARYNGSVGHSMLNHYRQHAYAGGQWGLEQDEPDALINELGPEIVVRDGSWFVLNNGDPTLANSPKSGLPGGLKKGDIIFNHLQTEEILKHGYVTGSHAKMIGGRAHADGTVTRGGSAFGGGGGRGSLNLGGGNKTTTKNKKKPQTTTKSTNKSSSSNKKSNNSSTKKANTASKATEQTAEDIDWIEILLDRLERQLDRLKIAADSTFRTFSQRAKSVNKEISVSNKEIKKQTAGYNRYIQQANKVGLSSKWAKAVRNGTINISTIKDDKLKEKIQKYQQWYEKALDCKKAIDELNESVKELNKQYFELDQTQYEGILENLEGKISAAEEWVNKREAQGYNIGTGAYTVMISQENTNIDQLVKERTALQSRLNAMIKNGTVARGSEEWNEMNNAIQSVKQSILEAYTQIEEWNKEIRQIGYDRFDAIQEKIADISAEAEFMNTVLKENELYNDNGFRNQYGEATLGLTAISYDAYLNQAEKYRSAVVDINKEINKEVTDKTTGKKTKPNLYNQELLDRRKELIEAQRTAIENAYKERDAMKSLVEEGYKKQLEALKKNIDEYTKLLDTQKDAYTYSSDIADKQEEINKLRKQVVSWAGDTSEEGRARRQKVEKELRDAEKALADKQEDRRIAQTKEMLSDLYDSYEKTLNSRLDDVDGLVRDLITDVNVGQSGIISTIKEAAGAVGYSFTDAMNVILNKGGTGLNSNMVGNIQNDKSSSNYGNATNNNRVADATTNTSSTKSIVTKAANQAASEDKTSKTGTTNAINTVTTKKNGWYTEGGKKYYYVDGTPYKNTTQTIAGKKYFFDKNGVMQKGWTYFKKNKKTRYFNSSGAMVTGNQTIGKVKYTFDKNGWLKLNTTAAKNRQATAKKNHAYRRGTSNVPYDEYAWTQEAGGEMILRKSDGAMLTPLGKGDMVFTNQMSKNLWNMAKDPLKALAGQVTSHASTSVNNTSVGDITNNFSFNLPNVKDSDEFIRELQHNKKFENIIKSMTLGTLSGKGSLNKFRTHI